MAASVVQVSILLVICVAALTSASASTGAIGDVNLPKLSIPACNSNETAHVGSFVLDSGSGNPKEQTSVDLCHDDVNIRVVFRVEDSSIESNYTECNDPLYKADAVEFFVSLGAPYPHHYLEIEVSPKNALFVAVIENNPPLDCSNITDNLVDCVESGIQHNVNIGKGFWTAEILLPWCFLKKSLGITCPERFDSLRANLYRINVNSGSSTEYSAWVPTMAEPACFHKPLYFGVFDIV